MRSLLVALVVAAVISPALAHANGNNAHTWIALRAVEYLPEGRLKEILSDPDLELDLLNGSMFPDGGYVIEDGYGETAHWEPFIDLYRAWIAANFAKPYSEGEAARHVAFLFGIASHGMADQVYDGQIMKMARVYDATNWGEGLLDGFDTASDVFLVADTGHNLVFDPWVPADEISQLYADELDYEVSAYTLYTAQDMLHRVVLSYPRDTGLNNPGKVEEYREQYPWTAANLMDPLVPGSPPCEAVVVASYWQSMWFRLHDQPGPDLVVATVPGAGGRGQPTDHTLIESQVVVVFGKGMDEATLTTDTVTVSADGIDHAIEVDLWRGHETNFLRLLPQSDWAADTEYVVTLHPGIAAASGEALTEPFTFSFSTATAGAEPIMPCTDPTPYAGEPELGESSGGCGVGRHPASLPMPLLVAALAIIWRARRVFPAIS